MNDYRPFKMVGVSTTWTIWWKLLHTMSISHNLATMHEAYLVNLTFLIVKPHYYRVSNNAIGIGGAATASKKIVIRIYRNKLLCEIH